jgi:HlyD family secretion protein
MKSTLSNWAPRSPRPTRRPGSGPATAPAVSTVLVVTIVCVVAAVVALAVWAFPVGRADSEPPGGTAVARRGDLEITVNENGNLRARDSISIMNAVEGNSTVAEIVPEGSFVQKGDLLLKMDSKEMEDRKASDSAALDSLKAEYEAAKINLDIQKKEAESAIAAAEQKVTFAEMDLKKYLEGDYPQSLRDADSAIKIAEAEYKQAETELYWTEKLFEKDAVTRQKVDTDKLNLDKARIAVEKAKKSRELLEQYQYVKQKATLEAACIESRRELARVKQQMQNNEQLKTAAVSSAKTRLDIRQDSFDRLLAQLDKMTIRAPSQGMIVYEKPQRWRGEQALSVGGSTYFRQKLMTLPDLSVMEIVVNVNETEIERVAVGQKATIIVDALPDRKYTGQVRQVAVMADANQRAATDVKEYEVVVSINESTEGLKPDMSGRAEIQCKTIKDQLLVPVTGIRMLRDHAAAIVKTSYGLEARKVKVGETNDKFIIITSGLEEGDEVLLYDPKVMPEIGWEATGEAEAKARSADEAPLNGSRDLQPPATVPGNETATDPNAAKRAELFKRLQEATSDEEKQKIGNELRALGGGSGRRGSRGGGENGQSRAPRTRPDGAGGPGGGAR